MENSGNTRKQSAPEVLQKKQLPSWHCDIYCRKIRHVTCEGRERADSTAAALCPFFDEMLY